MDPVTRESRARIAGKYDKNLENDLRQWISQRTGEHVGPDFIEGLRNGVILCKLAGVQKRINKPGMAFKEMENLENFNQRCRELGLNDADLFVTNDLYERANPTQVLQNIDALRTKLGAGLGGKSQGGYSGRSHHVRENESNRVFDSRPQQVNLKGGSQGLRDQWQGKSVEPQANRAPRPFSGRATHGMARSGGGASAGTGMGKFSLKSQSNRVPPPFNGHATQANSTPPPFGGQGGSGASTSSVAKFCPNCGKPNVGNKKFCADDGTDLSN